MSGASVVRFFGKIYGTERDYIIASGVLSANENPNDEREIEPRGEGTNTTVYWVTDNLLNDWVQLPESHPDT